MSLRTSSALPVQRTTPSLPGGSTKSRCGQLNSPVPQTVNAHGALTPLPYQPPSALSRSRWARSQVNRLPSSSASSTRSPTSMKSSPNFLFPLASMPRNERPLWARGEPKLAGASPMRCTRRRRRVGSAASQARTTSEPVECTTTLNGSSAPSPGSSASARSNASATSVSETSFASERQVATRTARASCPAARNRSPHLAKDRPSSEYPCTSRTG